MAMLGVAQALPPGGAARRQPEVYGGPSDGGLGCSHLSALGGAPGLQVLSPYVGSGKAPSTLPAACPGLSPPSSRPDLLMELGGGQLSHATLTAAVNEAARQSFGQELADVRDGPSGGFIVWLSGPRAKEVRADQAVLALFERQLWRKLGNEIMKFDRRNAAFDAVGSTSTLLTMWLLQDGADTQDLCWEFARRGDCPRGTRCRWLHASPPTRPVDIEVTTV